MRHEQLPVQTTAGRLRPFAKSLVHCLPREKEESPWAVKPTCWHPSSISAVDPSFGIYGHMVNIHKVFRRTQDAENSSYVDGTGPCVDSNVASRLSLRFFKTRTCLAPARGSRIGRDFIPFDDHNSSYRGATLDAFWYLQHQRLRRYYCLRE